jgi:hypothetical protein
MKFPGPILTANALDGGTQVTVFSFFHGLTRGPSLPNVAKPHGLIANAVDGDTPVIVFLL